MKSFFQNIWKIFQNRLVVLYIVIVMMFSVITVKLFDTISEEDFRTVSLNSLNQCIIRPGF